MRIYQNNGNGTINATQIEVDGARRGCVTAVWRGDYDNDGDLDILGKWTANNRNDKGAPYL
ncbi:MAG: VCBS repeat-containing protein [Elusimicrobia bacterium]|nr:VCBS repeat-containing protein [Elusimicrobiota bacterium]